MFSFSARFIRNRAFFCLFTMIPDAYLPEAKESVQEYLRAYVGTYLQKEIQQEQWVRRLEPFRRFLAIAAQMNGKIINRAKMV